MHVYTGLVYMTTHYANSNGTLLPKTQSIEIKEPWSHILGLGTLTT